MVRQLGQQVQQEHFVLKGKLKNQFLFNCPFFSSYFLSRTASFEAHFVSAVHPILKWKKTASSITLNFYRKVQDLARSDTLSLSKYYFYVLTKPLVLRKHMQREDNKDNSWLQKATS